MKKKYINDTTLLRLIDKEGMTQTAIAKEFGVTRQAISSRLRQLRPPTSFTVASTMIKETVERKLDVMDQLCNINGTTHQILDDVLQQDDPQAALRAVAEIRQQLRLQADLFAMLFDMDSAAQFQDAILEVLNEVDPEMRKLAIRKLNEKSALSRAIRFK